MRHFEAALRTVRYKAKESLSVKDRPNVHTRLVWISAEDAEGRLAALAQEGRYSREIWI